MVGNRPFEDVLEVFLSVACCYILSFMLGDYLICGNGASYE